MQIDLEKINKIYFIGIGGIGVSAIARMMLLRGAKVSGSDISRSEIIDNLEKLGATFDFGQSVDFIDKDVDLVVYSPAVTVYEPQLLVSLKERGMRAVSYPEFLGFISDKLYTVAISGAHGKTTTTGMVAKLFLMNDKDPTVIIGSILKDEKTNFIAGRGKYFIVEACEYKRSFLDINPKILVITNIDEDHLDYYKNLADIQDAFHELALKVPANGFIICDTKDPKVIPVLSNVSAKVVDYKEFLKEIDGANLKSPGMHNRLNASAAFAVGQVLNIPKEKIINSLENFSGTWRRFEYKGEKNGAKIYDDYAHHPAEIKATLSGVREMFPDKKVIVAFQPHLYSRTKLLLSEFSNAFVNIDEVLLAPIYAAREENDGSVTSEILAQKINEKSQKEGDCLAKSFEDFESIEEYVLPKLDSNTVFITMGAGDIYKVGEKILS